MIRSPIADSGLGITESYRQRLRLVARGRLGLRPMMGRAGVCCAAMIAYACSTALAQAPRTLYVNGTTGNNSWSGLCQTYQGGACGPKKTIQAGINVAVNGDTVRVANGTYSGIGNTLMTFGGRLITLRSENGPQYCTIDGSGGDTVLLEFLDGEGPTAVLEGFTLTHTELC